MQNDVIGGQRAITLRCDLKKAAGRRVCHVHLGLPQPACGDDRLVRSPANAPWSPDDGRLGGGLLRDGGGDFFTTLHYGLQMSVCPCICFFKAQISIIGSLPVTPVRNLTSHLSPGQHSLLLLSQPVPQRSGNANAHAGEQMSYPSEKKAFPLRLYVPVLCDINEVSLANLLLHRAGGPDALRAAVALRSSQSLENHNKGDSSWKHLRRALPTGPIASLLAPSPCQQPLCRSVCKLTQPLSKRITLPPPQDGHLRRSISAEHLQEQSLQDRFRGCDAPGNLRAPSHEADVAAGRMSASPPPPPPASQYRSSVLGDGGGGRVSDSDMTERDCKVGRVRGGDRICPFLGS